MSTGTNKAEAAVSYAALILADANINITADKLQTLLNAANIEDVEPIWTTLFAKALEGKDVKDLLTAVASGPAKGPEVATKDENDKDGNDKEGESDGNDDGDDASDSGSDIGMSLFD